MIEQPINNFLRDYYIPAIEELTFHLDHVQILGGNECETTRKGAMKSRQKYGEVTVIKYYAENTVSQNLYKFNQNIGETRINYIWKVLPWILSRTITLLEK